MALHADVVTLVGGTPLVKLTHMIPDNSAEVWAKLEGANPGASVKDRIALSMIEAAERDGRLEPGGTIVEPTSGNTGIGLAMIAAIKGYKLVLTMPDTMSIERRQMFRAYGADMVLSPGAEAMGGAIMKADELIRENPSWFMPQQFENPANPEVHRKTTALEILNDLDGCPDGFVAGVGTGGTITGVGEVLKDRKKDVWIAAVEPAGSPVLSGGQKGKHAIAGIGAGFIPSVLNTDIYDEIIQVSDDNARAVTREMALKEGLVCGISSGAALWAAMEVAQKLGKGKKVVVILPDRGERYLSTGLFGE